MRLLVPMARTTCQPQNRTVGHDIMVRASGGETIFIRPRFRIPAAGIFSHGNIGRLTASVPTTDAKANERRVRLRGKAGNDANARPACAHCGCGNWCRLRTVPFSPLLLKAQPALKFGVIHITNCAKLSRSAAVLTIYLPFWW